MASQRLVANVPMRGARGSRFKCLGRGQRCLLKTFWTGINGWADEQLPDGTEMLVGYSRPYVPATAKRRHSPGTPLSP